MKTLNLKQIEQIANIIRQDIIKMITKAGSGHPAGSLGMADVFAGLYFSGILNHDPKKPDWPNRDRVILSNGHICPVLYAVLAQAGYFPIEELSTLRKLGSGLQGHPHRESLPGIESSSGPVAHNTSVAAGMAYAIKMDKKKNQVYCFTGDGGHNQGQIWEAAMFAAKNKLDNLIFIIDRNNIQIDGKTEQIMPLESLKAKYQAFNCKVFEIDGHNLNQIINTLKKAKAFSEKPVAIIANTIPGKGVSFMENDFAWHGKAPTKKQAKQALQQLKQYGE